MPVRQVQMIHNNQFMSWMFWLAMKMMLIMFNLGLSVRIVSYVELLLFYLFFSTKYHCNFLLVFAVDVLYLQDPHCLILF